MTVSEKWGKDIKTATELALKELKITEDQAIITVLEEPSKGFLGMGAKLARVKVEKKEESIEVSNEDAEKAVESDDFSQKKVNEKSKTVDKKYDKRDFMAEKAAEQIVIVPENLEELNEHVAIDFIRDTTEKMGLDVTIKAKKNEENIYIHIDGKDAHAIIGKRGATLDALQYLVGLVVNKDSDRYYRVILDARDYRKKREIALIKLSIKLSNKVRKTGRPVKLEPMNPFERMVIHSAIQKQDGVTTRSEGTEPYRRVVVEPEK